MGDSWFDDEPVKRTLGIRDKQILWEKARHKCENPFCGKTLDFTEMQVGHKTAASKGGKANLKNCVCLCYKCNKLQGTDNWEKFLRKQKPQLDNSKTKNILRNLSSNKLKFLAKKFNLNVKGKTEEGFFENYKKPPSKIQYVNALAKTISEDEITSSLKDMPQPVKKRKRKANNSFW